MPIFLRTYHAMLHWKKATSHSFALMAQARGMSQWPLFESPSQLPSLKWKCQFRMVSISSKIEQGTFFGTTRGITPSRRSIFMHLWKWQRVWLVREARWTSILHWQLIKCLMNKSLSKWNITHDTNGNIYMTSPYARTSWVGANLTGSKVPVPWRLIPADSKFY